MSINHILHIEKYGQSVWMDDLSRDLLESGALNHLILTRGIRGLTSNPTIFERAIAHSQTYDQAIARGVEARQSVSEIYESLVFDDIRTACDVFSPIYESTQGQDGYVSLELPPAIAHDPDRTIVEAKRYVQAINRKNVMIKIPGTPAGLQAVESCVAAGINVNVTLLFSVQQYINTAWAYIRGLETRVARGQGVHPIGSVASFFLSRMDSKIDGIIDQRIQAGHPAAEQLKQLRGQGAIANAKVAYQEYQKIYAGDRWQALAERGALPQRLLWASTSTKDPAYRDVRYVEALIGPDTVTTLPPDTIEACADHCRVANRLAENPQVARQILQQLQEPPIDLDLNQIMAELLSEGLDKFTAPFDRLMAALQEKGASMAASIS
jgi:transaldolase